MTSKQRILSAIRRQKVDRAPAMPDFHMMFPSKLTGHTMWQVIGPRAEVPRREVRLQAFRHFGLDAWIDPGVHFAAAAGVPVETRIVSENSEQCTAEHVRHTPKGDLTEHTVYPKHEG